MEIRPHRLIKRKTTKAINVGKVKVGGNAPISVQSMTNTLTTDIKGTINQIHLLEDAGADIVRVSCPDERSTKALKEIIKEVSVPIVADIHFHYKRAIEAAEMGANCLRINPGNIGNNHRILDVVKAAKNALAPGIDSILAPIPMDCLISLYAGSEIPGVPASVIAAIF